MRPIQTLSSLLHISMKSIHDGHHGRGRSYSEKVAQQIPIGAAVVVVRATHMLRNIAPRRPPSLLSSSAPLSSALLSPGTHTFACSS